jgi:excisionase family DNA binding protein
VGSPTIWFSLRNAAIYAQLSPPTLVRAVKRGELIAFRVGGQRLLRFRAQDIDRWLLSSAVAS